MNRTGLLRAAGIVNIKRLVSAGLLLSILFLPVGGLGSSASAHESDLNIYQIQAASSPSEVVQLVNQLRQANGLPPYQVNNALMAAAQAHSEYQAAIGSVTHTGSGGSRPRDRAIAMGYGGGAAVYVSENIMGGNGMTAQKAVQWWQGDAPHLNTMLSPNYQDVGAGVAVSGGAVYITLDVGYVSGVASPQPIGATQPAINLPTTTPAPTLEIIMPVSIATPRPDGSIIHEVQQGQTLWVIADRYKVDLGVMLALNELSQASVIYPGEKLLLKAADVIPTIEPSPTFSPTLNSPAAPVTPTIVLSPTLSLDTPEADLGLGEATPVAMALLAEDNSNSGDTPTPEIQDETLIQDVDQQDDMSPILVVIVVLVVLGTALLLAVSLLRREA